ncbi:hypothetical protein FRX31_007948, partial [Thalictrum thalictroides]
MFIVIIHATNLDWTLLSKWVAVAVDSHLLLRQFQVFYSFNTSSPRSIFGLTSIIINNKTKTVQLPPPIQFLDLTLLYFTPKRVAVAGVSIHRVSAAATTTIYWYTNNTTRAGTSRG